MLAQGEAWTAQENCARQVLVVEGAELWLLLHFFHVPFRPWIFLQEEAPTVVEVLLVEVLLVEVPMVGVPMVGVLICHHRHHHHHEMCKIRSPLQGCPHI